MFKSMHSRFILFLYYFHEFLVAVRGVLSDVIQ